MRGYLPLLLALSASYTTITALPRPVIVAREPADEPKYSVVPLEPGDNDSGDDDSGSDDSESGSQGSGSGNGDDEDGDGIVTVIQTVVKTKKPVTHVVTKTGDASTVTATAPGKTVTKAV